MRHPYPVVDTTKSMRTFVRNMKKRRRMKRIGSGAYGDVYGTKTGRYVVKVGYVNLNDSMWGTHANLQYLRYLQMTDKYKANPLFPKLRKVEVFRHEVTEDHYMVVEMERLVVLKRNPGAIAGLIEYVLEDKQSFAAAKALFGKMSKHMEQAHKILYTMSDKHHAQLDLHSENVMMRKSGQIVITDPVC